jgi:type 1 fimbriae regulatory protein FimB
MTANTNRKFLSMNEVQRLVAAIPDNKNTARDKCMLLVCFIHGLRVTELRNLRLQDLDLLSNKLNINRLKNGFSVQHPIQSRERAALISWLAQRPQYLEADSDYLFLSRQGGQLSRQQLHRLIREYGVLANLDVPVHPHMLRHACGYALADKGIDTRLIQDYLGHKNIQNTVIYTASNVERFRSIKI